MSDLLEAALTAVGLIGGYMLAAVVVLAVTPKQRSLPQRLASAALALTALFALCVIAFVATEFWLDSYPEAIAARGGRLESGVPAWLDAWNKAAENMLSEVWQVWLAALYFAHREWPGSPESK